MAWEYTNADRALCKSNRIRLRFYNKNSGGYIYGCGTSNAKGGRVGSTVTTKTVDIEFQFPPKVLTDGRKGNWEEKEMSGGQEPVAVFVTSGPRELSLSWTYVVDSVVKTSDSWDIDRITQNIRRLRGYFTGIRNEEGLRDGLIVSFYMWCIGGTNPITARIKNIDVRYGDTMVFPPGGLSDRAFPLRTDITIELRVWTKGMIQKEAGWFGGGLEDDIGQQDLARLAAQETPDWY